MDRQHHADLLCKRLSIRIFCLGVSEFLVLLESLCTSLWSRSRRSVASVLAAVAVAGFFDWPDDFGVAIWWSS
jgi:hypothetical protein